MHAPSSLPAAEHPLQSISTSRAWPSIYVCAAMRGMRASYKSITVQEEVRKGRVCALEDAHFLAQHARAAGLVPLDVIKHVALAAGPELLLLRAVEPVPVLVPAAGRAGRGRKELQRVPELVKAPQLLDVSYSTMPQCFLAATPYEFQHATQSSSPYLVEVVYPFPRQQQCRRKRVHGCVAPALVEETPCRAAWRAARHQAQRLAQDPEGDCFSLTSREGHPTPRQKQSRPPTRSVQMLEVC